MLVTMSDRDELSHIPPEEHQEFREFRRYRELERARHDRPALDRFLNGRFFRRVSALVLTLAFLTGGYEYLFGDDGEDDWAQFGPGPKAAPGRLAESPATAMYALYNGISKSVDPKPLCFLFDDRGASEFARSNHVPSCEEAVRLFYGKTDRDPRSFLTPGKGSPRGVAEISSCAADLKPGTARLGRFLFTEPLPGEWLISGHSPEPDPCPRAATRPPPPSPANAVRDLHSRIATGDVLGACGLFTSAGQSEFARSRRASSCGQAVRALRVTDPAAYARSPVESDAAAMGASSCMGVTGGPPLGRFTLALVNGVWKITGHQPCGP
jgi:hypothetical protein